MSPARTTQQCFLYLLLFALIGIPFTAESQPKVGIAPGPPRPGGRGFPGSPIPVPADFAKLTATVGQVNEIGFGNRATFRKEWYSSLLTTGDVDGDGKKEIIVGVKEDVVVLDQALKEKSRIAVGKTSSPMQALEKAGFDFISSERSASYQAKKYLKTKNLLEIGSNSWRTPVNNAWEVDLDGDGSKEVVIMSMRPATCVTSTYLFVFSQDGKHLWSWQCDTWISQIAFDDVDGDGTTEIVVSTHYTSPVYLLGKGGKNKSRSEPSMPILRGRPR